MAIDRYKTELRKCRGKLAEIHVIDTIKHNLIFRFKYPKRIEFDFNEFLAYLEVFFNYEPKDRLEKQKRKYALQLSGKYPAVFVCSQILMRVKRRRQVKFQDNDLYYSDYKQNIEEDPFMYVGLRPYTIAKLCEIDCKTCNLMMVKLLVYLQYLTSYLKHKRRFDGVLRSLLARRTRDTVQLKVVKKLLLNPFRNSGRAAREFGIAESDVRKCIRRLLTKCRINAGMNNRQIVTLKALRYKVLYPFKEIVFDRKKGYFMKDMKSPRVEYKDYYPSESDLYKSWDLDDLIRGLKYVGRKANVARGILNTILKTDVRTNKIRHR